MNDHCPFPNFFAYIETTLPFAKHSLSLSFVPQEMSLNIDIKRILPVTFSGVSSNLISKRLTSSLSCNVLNPGIYSTRIPLAHRRFCQSFCILKKISTIQFFTRARRAPAPAASPGECCKRATCHGHALDRRESPGTTASPRRTCACSSLRGICLRLSRRVAFVLQRHWRHVIRRWQQRHSR